MNSQMHNLDPIYILGSGAVGFPLALYLTRAGRRAVAVRTSRTGIPSSTVTVTVQNGADRFRAAVETVSLDQLEKLDGLIVVTTKAHANGAIAQALKDKAAGGPIVIMQNGVGVEKPFLDAGFAPLYRCILYVTGQTEAAHDFTFRSVTSSPIGLVTGGAVTGDLAAGEQAGLTQCVEALTTDGVPFHAEANIQRAIWKKAILNSVFNSICPLLDADNGIFARSDAAFDLAGDIVRECVTLTEKLNIGLSESELLDQIKLVSRTSDGQLISTLQDIRSGRPTEIEFLNLEIARMATTLQPALHLPKTELLGKMIVAKSLVPTSTSPTPLA